MMNDDNLSDNQWLIAVDGQFVFALGILRAGDNGKRNPDIGGRNHDFAVFRRQLSATTINFNRSELFYRCCTVATVSLVSSGHKDERGTTFDTKITLNDIFAILIIFPSAVP